MGAFISAYAILGVVFILSSAIVRLFPIALEPLLGPLEPIHVAAYASSVLFLGYTEGYKAFQKQYSPRVVARALRLGEGGKPLLSALAPFVAMGLLHATKKRLIVSWSVTAGVVALVLIVRTLDQPWRGAVDAGVVVGLGWGTIAILAYWAKSFRGAAPDVATDFPD